MKTTLITEPSAVLEIRTVWTEIECNELLATKKWALMQTGIAHRDETGYNAKPVYILAKIKK